MGLQAVTWFEIEKYPSALNSLLLLFDDIYVPNTLWLETGSKFEDIYFKISLTQNEIYDVVITPVFLGGDPVQNSIPFIEVYGALPMERKEEQGRFVPFFEVLHNVNEYPPSISNIIKIIFDKINKVSPFQEYNKFTYDYAPLIRKGLNFIGRKETRGNSTSHWFDNYRDYIERCLDIQNNMPIVFDAKSILDIEKYRSHSATSLKYNPEMLVSALLLSLANVHIKEFITSDLHIILDLRESVQEEKTAFVNKIREHSMSLHKLLDKDASFEDLLNESEFVVKTEILPAYENARIRYEREMSKTVLKKFITFTDKIMSFGFSAFTLNYSETKQSLSSMYNICTGKALRNSLLASGESYSNYLYLLRVEQETT